MNKFNLLVILYLIKSSIGELPSSIPICRRNDPQLSQCIANAIEALKPKLITGDFGDGYAVPKLEPMYFKEMDFEEQEGMKLHLQDLNLYGVSNFHVEKLRTNIKDLKFDALINIPKFTGYAKYKIEFNFLGAKLKTSGDYFFVHENVKLVLPFRLKRVIKNGLEVVRTEPILVRYDKGVVKQLKLSNLFGGNKAIEEIIHALIISNQDYTFKNVNPIIEANLSKMFTDITNRILENATLDEMFPI